MKSLQDTYAPDNKCFGCGAANEKGLRIKSFPQDDAVICDWAPQGHHDAFPGVLNGGICGAVLDCHSNWTAAYHLMRRNSLGYLPCTVTADFHVVLKRPTPTGGPIHLSAHVTESSEDRATVEAKIEAGWKVNAA